MKPLTVYTANHPAMSLGHDGCVGFGGFLYLFFAVRRPEREGKTELRGSGVFDK